MRARSRQGQIALVLAFVLAAIALLALMNVDVFDFVRAKSRLQDGGDAAALAAARVQGSLLNELGRLNAGHLAAAVRDDTNACLEIEARQRRIALLGPVDALRAADEAARKNGMETRPEFSEILRAHLADVRTVYCGANGEGDPYPEPYPGAWLDYANAIDNAMSGGLAAGPDNLEFYFALSGHLLLKRSFYQAIAARDWCWFHFNCPGLLEQYSSYRDWEPLPARRDNPMANSEVFSLHVDFARFSILERLGTNGIAEILRRYTGEELRDPDALVRSALVSDPDQQWAVFDPAWSRWFDGYRLCGDDDGVEFPLAGEIRPEYNVRGCAAVCRCAKDVDSVANGGSSGFTWSAAAKPFGTLEDLSGLIGPTTSIASIVLPCFTDVRLVPLDSVGGEDLATADAGWVFHLRRHVPDYLENGPRRRDDCFYCRQLVAWERESFRQAGSLWLKFNSGKCRLPSPGGPSGRGGTSHGH